MRWQWIICIAVFAIVSCKDEKPQEQQQTDTDEKLPAYVLSLEEKVTKYPDSTSARYRLIEAYDSLGLYQQAMAHTDQLIRRDSANNAVWMRKALLQEKLKDTTGAIISYVRSINIYPAPDAQLYLANLFAERKNDTALLLINAVANLMSDDRTLAECDFIAGIYHARKGNISMAEKLFDRCIARERKFMEAYVEKGLLYFDRKNYSDALKVFQLAANVEPTYADAFYFQGRCLEALGRTEDATNMYQQSLRLDPSLKEAATALSRLGVQLT